MIEVRGIKFDFDAGRVKDAELMEEAKPKLEAAFEVLKNPKGVKASDLSDITVNAVSALLGEDAPEKLSMDKERYVDCITIFADAATAVMANQSEVNESLAKYSRSRLGM